MRLAGYVFAIVAALWALDRVLVWLELRGYIVYRLTPRVRRSGAMFAEVDALLQPGRRHVFEVKQGLEVYREQDDAAGPGGVESRGDRVDGDRFARRTPHDRGA